MDIRHHIADHRVLSSHRDRAVHRRAGDPGEVAHQLWVLVERCTEGLERSAARGGPTPRAHLAELRRTLLRTRGRLGRRSEHRRQAVDTVVALLEAQLDPRVEPPAIPLVSARTGQATPESRAVVRHLRAIDEVLHLAA